MSVRLSHEVEKEMALERAKNREKISWEIYRTTSLVEAVHKARDAGWAKKLVQVRFENLDRDVVEYVVEPFEENCGCSGLLRYRDFYDEER